MTEPEGMLSEGLHINGEISGAGSITIQGQVDGRIAMTERVTVDPSAVVKADVEASELVVHGQVSGSVTARTRTELGSTATIEGELSTPLLVVAEGAVIHADLHMALDLPEDI